MAKEPEITSEQLRRSIGDTLKRVSYGGQSFTVTFHGKPVARIVPVTEDKKGKRAKPKS